MDFSQYIKMFRELPEPIAKSLWVSDFNSITTHIRGNRSNDLIGKRRPNEPEDVKEFRNENYRAITRDCFNKAMTNLVRTLGHSHVDIKYPEDISSFLNDTNFYNKTFLGYFESEIIRKMIEMANGFLVWWPENVGNENEEIFMRPIIVSPDRVQHFTKDVFTWLSDEKSEVTYGGKQQFVGDVYYTIMNDQLYKRRQTGKKTDNIFVWDEYYTNPTGMIYALVLGGDVTSKHEKGVEIEYYTSFFSPAIPFADEAISDFSDYQGVKISCAYPLREVESLDCNHVGCTDGKIFNEVTSIFETCDTCHGTGRLPMSPSPYGVIIRPKRTGNITAPESAIGEDVIKFHHADSAILEHLAGTWEKQLQLAEKSLNQIFTDSSQSGVAKEIDREDKIATLDKIGRHLYNYLIKNSIQIIHKFMVPNSEWIQVQIILPETFVPKTQVQLQEELSQFKTLNLPDSLVMTKMRELMRKTVNGDPFQMKIFDTQILISPTSIRTFEEKMRMLAVNAMDELQFKRDMLVGPAIVQFANERPDFMDLTYEEITNEVNALIDTIINSGTGQ
jgi:hypothetical protein